MQSLVYVFMLIESLFIFSGVCVCFIVSLCLLSQRLSNISFESALLGDKQQFEFRGV